ncbi:MAG: hypothetical protein IJT23_01565 [Clostridia bacterium]|nr:hypothetical protein [Clostridia bacterium]
MNKLEKYITPNIEIYDFKDENIITSSTNNLVPVDGFNKGKNATYAGQIDASGDFFGTE